METRNSRWREALLVGGVLVACLGLLGYGLPVLAQEPAEEEVSQEEAIQQALERSFAEEITVTGSLIPRPTLEAMSPVTTMTLEELSYRGTTRLEDLLTTMPQVFASQNNIIANGASGTATVNLRNLGEVRTLVLIDGRRMTAGDPNSPGADLNFIPAALVKRVDILTGGASATYGADAVAGVVNFIIDRDFEGVRGGIQFSGFNHDNSNALAQQLQADAGFSSPTGMIWDGNNFNANIALGHKFGEGRGHASMYIDYRNTREVLKGARDYTNCSVSYPDEGGPGCSGSSTSDTGRFEVYRPHDPDAPPVRYGSYTLDTSGEGNTWKDRAGYVWNFAPYNFLQRPDERWAGGGFLNYEFNKHAEGYLEVMLMHDKTDAQIAPAGDFYGSTFLLNVDNPLLSAQQRGILLAAGWGPNDIAEVTIGRRSVETGGRIDHLSHNSWRFVAGVRGELGRGWAYDLNGLLAEVSAPEAYENDFNSLNIQNALLAVTDPETGEAVCMNAAARAAGCIPWNIFRVGGVTQEQTDYLTIDLLSHSGTSTRVATAKVTGDLGQYGLTLPGAKEGIQVAGGFDYGVFGMFYYPDQAYQDGIASGQGAALPPTDGSYSVRELFAEALIPLVQGARGAEDLTLELGYRYSDYSTSGGWPTYKAQGSWAPGSGLKFRAGFTRATRSPNPFELFQPTAYLLGGSTDPCATDTPQYSLEECARTGVTPAQYGFIDESPAGQYNTLGSGNVDLDPEVADTITYGVVWAPKESGFSAALDYYNIEVNDTIGAYRADDIIKNCLETGDPYLCSLIHRDRFGSLWIVQGEAYTEVRNTNVGMILSEGVDVNLSYLLPVGKGFLDLSIMGTYLLSNTTDTGFYRYDCVGYHGDICNNFYGVAYGLTPEWRHLFRASWETGPFVVTLGWRMLSEMTHECASSATALNAPDFCETMKLHDSYKIPAAHYLDLAFNWQLTDNVQFILGCNNVLDKEPFFGSGIDNIDYGPGYYGAYDVYGRFLHSAINFQF